MKRIIILVGIAAGLIIPAAASASAWRYQKMNRGEQIGFVSDIRAGHRVINGVTHVCPKDRGYVAASGRIEYGMYFTDCPERLRSRQARVIQGALIFARKTRPGSWRALTAGTSPFPPTAATFSERPEASS